MKIGLKARFSDLDQVLQFKPELVEFQFSDKDPDSDFKRKTKYSIPCIIHLPEVWNGYFIDIANIGKENQVLSLKDSRQVLQKTISKSERFFNYFTNRRNIFILHPGGMTYERDDPKNNKCRMEVLIESLSKIKTVNSEILIENLPPFPWYFGGQWNSNFFMDAEEINTFCKNTKRKICYDVSHSRLYCNFSKKNFFDQFEISKKNLEHIHISDAVNLDGEGIQIDEGEIDFSAFFNGLKTYDGYIVPEIWMGYTNGFLGFKTAIKKIQKYLHKIQYKK